MSTNPSTRRDVCSRRDLAVRALVGLTAPLWGGSAASAAASTPIENRTADGVRLGVQTASFRELPSEPGSDAVGTLIHALTECNVSECELFPSVVEPAFGNHASGHHSAMSSMSPQMMRRELRKWRLRMPLSYFQSIGSRFQKAGVQIHAYQCSLDSTFSDEEIDRGFSMAKALGAEILTASMTLDSARRVAPFAEKHRMVVAFSGPGRVHDAHHAANPSAFEDVLKVSPFFKLNVDIGQLTAGNVDPVAFVRDHHAEINSLYLTDRRKDGGEAVVWGHGDTPIREVLQLLKRERWPIRAYVDYQYRGEGTALEEVKRCFAYAKQVLA